MNQQTIGRRVSENDRDMAPVEQEETAWTASILVDDDELIIEQRLRQIFTDGLPMAVITEIPPSVLEKVIRHF